MGKPVYIIGETGSGKTYSIKNMKPDEVGIFSVKKGTLPFMNNQDFKVAKHATYDMIISTLKEPKLKRYVIDDSQYLMVDEFFARANETGYKKFVDIGKKASDLLEFIAYEIPDDVIVFLLHHSQVTEEGKVKAKTVGKMVDNYLTLEGCVDVCLHCITDGKKHSFITQSDGSTTAKSPEGMFELEIPNDLAFVDARMREYYGL